ncbi:MAG TPA: hypothetical protein VNN73_18115 [Blastocatellia bacterium]|nr:hypothetical protein [Blastocatellia bacterium]
MLVIAASSARAQDPQLPPPPLPTDSTPLIELLSTSEQASVAEAGSNAKKLVETYVKIADAHLDTALALAKNEDSRTAVRQLDIYNKAMAEACKLAFSQEDGKRKLSKKLEQSLYKQIKTLETINLRLPLERQPFADAALKQAKQLRVQALNEAFAGGEILKDPDEVNKVKNESPGKDQSPPKNDLPESAAKQLESDKDLPAQFRFASIKSRYVVAQIPGDYLTEEEDDHVREAQDPEKRIKVFMKIADRRLAALTGNQSAAPADKKAQKRAEEEEREWGAIPKLSRAELLRHYARAIEECMVKLEDAYERNPKSSAIPKALAILRDATDKHLEILRSFHTEVKGDSEERAWRDAVEEAETANKGARDGLKGN